MRVAPPTVDANEREGRMKQRSVFAHSLLVLERSGASGKKARPANGGAEAFCAACLRSAKRRSPSGASKQRGSSSERAIAFMSVWAWVGVCGGGTGGGAGGFISLASLRSRLGRTGVPCASDAARRPSAASRKGPACVPVCDTSRAPCLTSGVARGVREGGGLSRPRVREHEGGLDGARKTAHRRTRGVLPALSEGPKDTLASGTTSPQACGGDDVEGEGHPVDPAAARHDLVGALVWERLHTDPDWNSRSEVRDFLYRDERARNSISATQYAFPHAHLATESRVVDFCEEIVHRKRFRHLPVAIVTVFIRPHLRDLTPEARTMLKTAFALLGKSLTVVAPFDDKDPKAFGVWKSMASTLGEHIAQLVLIGTNLGTAGDYINLTPFWATPRFRKQLQALPRLRRLVVDVNPFLSSCYKQVATAERIAEYVGPMVDAIPEDSALEAFVVHSRFRSGLVSRYAMLVEGGKFWLGPEWARRHGVQCGTFRTGLMKVDGAWVVDPVQLCTGEDDLTREAHVRPGYFLS
ncbi:hypothetical protein SCHPADRAFT_895863 [Schizopora paradoxa]|uniref:Uncharacterized protein n=1 Tax=Schizopora paradoxa TaxID=27342 RepID=A0A0H2R2G8_9AGAM|nr:hypothetical protein SCHPADRAFT_895863 [Schizopora paradoxa]